MVNVAVVDDEIENVETIAKYIRYYEEEKGGKEAFRILKYYDGKDLLKRFDKQIDIIFLDIEMQYVDGMSAARKIRKVNSDVVIIFVTKLAQMAIKGYEVEALDFIVKPVEYYAFELRFIKALNYLKKHEKKRIAIYPIGEGVRYVLSSDLYYIDVQGRHVTYHTKEGNFTENGHLNEVEQNLSDSFRYCNRWCIVNLSFVTAVGDGTLTVAGEEISLSRGRRDEILSALLSTTRGER
ncbi:MAG: response regulator transcription factor [Clostridia bacterium]|nr:response regulator transcription factor [Clostridia bacterium]